jgi:hypothetical protein
MLAFLKDAKPVLEEIVASIVSDMMNRYTTAIFVRKYGGEGFFSQSLTEPIVLFLKRR